jgi:hypothetical protein
VFVFSFIFQRFQLHCWSVAVTNLKCETYNIPYYYNIILSTVFFANIIFSYLLKCYLNVM